MGVEAAGTVAGGKHVPKGELVLVQKFDFLGVIVGYGLLEGLAYEGPELVTRMGVVGLLVKRFLSGHAAEYQ